MKTLLLALALLMPFLAQAQQPSPTYNSLTLLTPLAPSSGGTGVTTSTGTGATVHATGPTLNSPIALDGTQTGPTVLGLRTLPYAALVDGAQIVTSGYYAAGDHGGGTFAWSAASTAADDGGITIAPTGISGAGRWVRQLNNIRGIPSQFFGGMCDSTYADTHAAYISAATAAETYNKKLIIGGSPYGCILTSTITLPPVALDIEGDGQSNSNLILEFNGPAFTWNTNAAVIEKANVHDFTVTGQYGSTDPYNLSGVIAFGGDNSLFEWGTVHDITAVSLYQPFYSNKATITDPQYGPAGSLDWMHFDNITILPGSRDSNMGVNFTTGSGTGNTFQGWKTQISAVNTAIFNFGGGVVGDLIISGHLAGSTNTTVLSVASTATYRQNIDTNGAQLDGGVTTPFNFPSTGGTFAGIHLTGNNIGGGVSVSVPPLLQSTIDDQMVSSLRAGNAKTSTTSGAQTIPLFSVTSGDAYGGTMCDVSVSGQVFGVAGGLVYAKYFFASQGSAIGAIPIVAPVASNSASGFFSLTTSASGNVITVNATMTPVGSSPTSTLNAQIACTNGTAAVSRL